MEEIAHQFPDEDHIKKFHMTTAAQRRELFKAYIY